MKKALPCEYIWKQNITFILIDSISFFFQNAPSFPFLMLNTQNHIEAGVILTVQHEHAHNLLFVLWMAKQSHEDQEYVYVALSFYLVICLFTFKAWKSDRKTSAHPQNLSEDSNLQQTVRMLCFMTGLNTRQTNTAEKNPTALQNCTVWPSDELSWPSWPAWELLSSLLNPPSFPFCLPPLNQVDMGWLSQLCHLSSDRVAVWRQTELT